MNLRSVCFLFIVKSFILIIAFSCAEDAKLATLTVSNGSFSNSLMIEGFVEPVKSTAITTPRTGGGVIQFLVEDGEQVEEGQVVCIIENQNLQSSFEQMTTSFETAEVGLNKTRADLAMQYAILEAQVRTNEADTKIAQMDSLQIAFMTQNQKKIKELELEKATIEKNRYEKKLEALKVIQQSEIKRYELEIQRFKTNVESMKERIDELTLKAPHSGVVIRSNNPVISGGGGMMVIMSGGGGGQKFKVGDNIYGNFAVATIPDFKEMKVKIMAPESDFKLISVNDSVSYTFDAMPGNKGSGKILKKSPMGQPYKYGSPIKFFEIEASIDSVDVVPDPGFTTNCRIIFKQVESVISVPQIAIFEEDSMKVVYVQRKNKYERRQVLTDLSSLTEAVVTNGLQEGDVIALSKPKFSLVKETIALPDSITQKPAMPVDTLKQERIPEGMTPGMVPNMPQRIVQPSN